MNLKGREHYQAQRRAAWERDGGKCVVCREPGTEVHHRRGRGGPDPHSLENLIVVDGDCHRRIHGNPAWSYGNGYMVRRLGIETAAAVPIIVGGLPRWLSEDGKAYPRKDSPDARL